MKSCRELPEGYAALLQIDLQKDKKCAWLVNGLALLIAIVMVVCALRYVPFGQTFESAGELGEIFIKPAVLLGGMIGYIFLHELVHGIFMKALSGVKPKYGFTGLYAYAGSEAYFGRRDYILIALAPVVIWGVVLAVINWLVPPPWFWVVYLVQVINVSGAAGDLYVTAKLMRSPPSILIQDVGVSITVYNSAAIETE